MANSTNDGELVVSSSNDGDTPDSNTPEKELDQIFSEMGFGLWQLSLILILCFSAASDNMELTLLSFLAPCVEEEWGLSDSEESLITSIAFAGEIVGATVFGILADFKGRKFSLALSLSMIIIGGVATYFSVNFAELLSCRMVVGIGVGGCTVAWDYLAETMPPEPRGKCMLVIAVVAGFGDLLVSGLAWAFLDEYGWHFLAAVCVLPSVITLMMLFTISESPRWLLTQGKLQEAKKALDYGARLNGNQLDEFNLKTVAVSHHQGHFWEIFKGSLRKPTFHMLINWILEGFVYFGNVYMIALLLLDSGTECEFKYENIFISTLAPIIFLTITFIFVDRSRTMTLAISFLCAAVFLMFYGAGYSDSVLTVFTFTARGLVGVGCATIWITTPEFYPTEIRASANAFFYILGRFGSFAAAFWVYSGLNTEVIAGVLALVCLVISVNSFLMEDTAGLHLDDIQGATPDRPQKRKKFNGMLKFTKRSSKNEPENQAPLL